MDGAFARIGVEYHSLEHHGLFDEEPATVAIMNKFLEERVVVLQESSVERGCLVISPIVNMEKLITDMMMWSNVTEDGEHWFHTDAQMKFLDNWIRTITL